MYIHELDDLEKAYTQAFSAAVVIEHPSPGLLRLSGSDRLDLLHRISTNDLDGLSPGTMRRTILTNALARIVDVITLFAHQEELLVMTSPEREADVEVWLRQYVFFQDDVRISRDERKPQHWGIYGPEASACLKELGITLSSLGPGRFQETGNALLWQVTNPKPGGYELLAHEDLHRSLRKTSDERNCDVAEMELFQILRIESGMPSYGAEITGNTIPLEVGLWDEISFDKGCYIGQEILARLESRGQLARRLILIGCDGKPAPGMPVYASKREVGRMTSVAHSPRQGWIGLALVNADAISGVDLTAGDEAIRVRVLDRLQSARVTKKV